MNKTLDFNSIKKPTLTLTMPDEERTVIRVLTPTVELVEKLTANEKDLTKTLKTPDRDGVMAAFELAAEYISINKDGITVTAEDLRGKYNWGIDELIIFFSAYKDFVETIETAKN